MKSLQIEKGEQFIIRKKNFFLAVIVILFIAGTSFALFQYNCIKNSVNIEHIVNCRNAMVHGNNMNVDSSELFRIVKCDFKCDEPYVLIDQTCTGIKIEDGFVTSIVLGENGKVHNRKNKGTCDLSDLAFERYTYDEYVMYIVRSSTDQEIYVPLSLLDMSNPPKNCDDTDCSFFSVGETDYGQTDETVYKINLK